MSTNDMIWGTMMLPRKTVRSLIRHVAFFGLNYVNLVGLLQRGSRISGMGWNEQWPFLLLRSWFLFHRSILFHLIKPTQDEPVEKSSSGCFTSFSRSCSCFITVYLLPTIFSTHRHLPPLLHLFFPFSLVRYYQQQIIKHDSHDKDSVENTQDSCG